MYVRRDYPLKDKNPAYIVRLEKRNWIRVENEGGYVAKFFIQYEENGSTVTKESGDLPILSHKVWHLPPETRKVLINAQGHTGLKWNTIHRGDVAVNCTYTAGGTAPAKSQWLRVEDATGKKASY